MAESPPPEARPSGARKLTWSMLEGVREVPREAWNALVGDESPFLEWEWLASLEEAGCVGPETGWAPRPLVGYEGDQLVAACPLYLKGHSEGEFVFDWGWADAAHRAGIDYYPKLLVGVPFTPVTGARFLTAPGRDRAALIGQMAQALLSICEQNELSGIHVNFRISASPISTTTWRAYAASDAIRFGASAGSSAPRASRSSGSPAMRSPTISSSRCSRSISPRSATTRGAASI
jgi:predicted N-acyltransferase